jgi:hypothetical protein
VNVPVYLPAAPTPTEQFVYSGVQDAVAKINTKLAAYLALNVVNTPPANGAYIQVSYNTAYVPPGSSDYATYCANVSTAPNVGTPISPSASNGIAEQVVYINLGNGHCQATPEVIAHEFGHALGLDRHNLAFGLGNGAYTPVFWDMLATLYGNPASSGEAALHIYTAAP